MKEYSIITTYNCNWDCPYCPRITNNKHRNFRDVLDAALTIEPNSEVSLSGGEPGTLKEDDLLELMNILQEKGCVVTICSNGEIFKHKRVLEVTKHILYHCSMNMDIDDVVVKNVGDIFIEYMVVVTDNNFNNLDGFLKKHNDIKISLIPGKGNILNDPSENLSHGNIIRMIRSYREYMTKENLKLLLSFSPESCGEFI